MKILRPLNNLAVRVDSLLSAEWRPSNQTFEHDGSNGPPITAIVITLARENLRCNVIGRSYSGIGKLATRFSPGVDLGSVGNGELDFVNGDRVPVVSTRLLRAAHQLLVVRRLVFLVEPSRETEVSQLDVTSSV